MAISLQCMPIRKFTLNINIFKFKVFIFIFYQSTIFHRSLAEHELGWKANRSLEQMCSDFWRWQKMNPSGYKTILTNGHNH